jgi:membrane protein YdbS with pleckstrin-like domain
MFSKSRNHIAMTDRFVLNHIRSIPLFERLSPDQLGALSTAFQVLRFEPGEIVFAQGQPTQGMFVFVSGKALLSRQTPQGDQSLGLIGGGQYINEAALNEPMIESATLRVLEPSVVLFLSRARMDAVLTAQPSLQSNLRGRLDAEEIEVARQLFTGQRPTETIIHAWRLHQWVWIRQIPIPVIVGGAVGAAAFFLSASSPSVALALGGLALVILVTGIAYLYFEWRDDALILTSERMVKIHNNLLTFTRSLSEIPLERVIEVRSEIPAADLMARAFGYGTVFIRTAGESGSLTVPFIPNPQAVQSAIFAERDRFQQLTRQRSQLNVRADIERALGISDGAGLSGSPASLAGGGVGADSGESVRRSGTQGLAIARTRFTTETGETVYRKHFTVWLAHIALPSIALILGLIGIIAAIAGASIFGDSVAPIIALSLGVAVFLFGVVWFYMADWDWRNDTITINPQTITIIHKRPLWLQNEIDQISLTQIDNVISDVQGLFNSLLNRGEVRIFLLGAGKPKIVAPIYAPQELHAEISRRQAELKNRAQQRESQSERDAIVEYLRAYHEANRIQQAQPASGAPAPGSPTPSYANPPPPPYTPPAPPPPARQPAPPPAAPPPSARPANAPFFDPSGGIAAPPPPPPGTGSRPPNIPRPRS